MTITIIGSAPILSPIPDSRKTYFASSSAYQKKVKHASWGQINCVFPIGVIETGAPEPERSLFLEQAPYDRLFLRQSLWSLGNFWREESYKGLTKELETLTYRKMLSLVASETGFLSLFLRWSATAKVRELIHGLLKFRNGKVAGLENLSALLLSGRNTKVSSGILATLLALEEAQSDEEIGIFGITVSRNAYAYELTSEQLKDGVDGHQGHLSADIFVLQKLLRKYPNQIQIDDTDLRNLLLQFKP